jgi:hypothetical protein
MDAASSALKKKDKNISAEIVDALCSMTCLYGNEKHKVIGYWNTIPIWMRKSPDFLALSDEAITNMKSQKVWVEWKVLRQYQMLFSESLKFMKEICYHIAMNTRLIGENAVTHKKKLDLATLDMVLKFFNTYLRAGINQQDVRTVYTVLYQYRLLGEHIICQAKALNDLVLLCNRLCSFFSLYRC